LGVDKFGGAAREGEAPPYTPPPPCGSSALLPDVATATIKNMCITVTATIAFSSLLFF